MNKNELKIFGILSILSVLVTFGIIFISNPKEKTKAEYKTEVDSLKKIILINKSNNE